MIPDFRGVRRYSNMDDFTSPTLADATSRLLGEARGFYRIRALRETTSTNDDIKAAARDGAMEGLVILAERQTAGRGRMRRAFFSPDATGLYMSVLLRPSIPAADAVLITAAAAVAVAEAIESLSGRGARIKWVNDVFLDGKKVCGILTEGSVAADGLLEYAALGIGVNVAPPPDGFPEPLQHIAGAVFGPDAPPDARARLAAEILARFFRYRTLNRDAFLNGYRERSLVVGRDVLVTLGGEIFPARAVSIDDDCRLVVESERGAMALCAGEVSVRPVEE